MEIVKRKVLFSILFLAVIFILTLTAATIYSFKAVRPASVSINKNLASYFGKIVRIPNGITSPMQTFEETVYSWEMETNDKEVVGVTFRHNTAYSKTEDQITVSLEMNEGQDASIFMKVLPAILVDSASLSAAHEPQKANLQTNPSAGYDSLKLQITPQTNQTTKLTWVFKKSDLPEEIKKDYKKLNKSPDGLTRFLYSIPSVVVTLLAG